MIKKISLFLVLVFCVNFQNQIYGKILYESIQGYTEVRYWDKSNAYQGYTLFAAHGTTYLIDMEGYVINKWEYWHQSQIP